MSFHSRFLSRLAILVAATAISACASTPGEATAEANTESQIVTGSRIKQNIDPESEAPATRQPVRVVDRDELDRTGAVNLEDALKRSVPQINR